VLSSRGAGGADGWRDGGDEGAHGGSVERLHLPQNRTVRMYAPIATVCDRRTDNHGIFVISIAA
jgi:hypothetical protein